MLKSLRRSVQSTFVKIFLFGLLIVSFGMWGTADVFTSSPENRTVATVADAELDFPNYAQQFQIALRQTGLLNAGIEITPASGQFIERTVLNRWALGVALQAEVAKMRLTLSDDELRETIRSNPDFRNGEGQFSRSRFESFLGRNGFSEAMYLAGLRKEILQNRLIHAALSSTPSPPAQGALLDRYERTFRSAQFIEILATPLMRIPEATNEQLDQFYTLNNEQFRKPEQRIVEILKLSLDNIATSITLEEFALEEYFTANRNQLSLPERRGVERILFPDEDNARQAWLAIENGMDFIRAAEQFAEQSPEATSLGLIERENFTDSTLADTVFRLDVGTISDPFEGLFGWMIARTVEIKPEEVPQLENIRQTIERELRQERAADQIFDYVDQIEDQLAGGATLEEIARNLPLPRESLKIAMVDDDTSRERLRTQIASLAKVGNSAVFEDNEGGFRLIELQEITAAHIPPLENIIEATRAAWRKDQQYQRALQEALVLSARIRQGESLAKVAETAQLNQRNTVPVNRDGRVLSEKAAIDSGQFSDLQPESGQITALFALTPDAVVAVPSKLGARVMVLGEEIIAETTAYPKNEILKSQLAIETYLALEDALRTQYPLRIHRTALDYMYEFLNGNNT